MIKKIIEKTTREAEKLQEVKEKCQIEEQELRNKVYDEIMVGATDEFRENYFFFPMGLIHPPVQMPSWMFRELKYHKNLLEGDLERVALAHVIHFTAPDCPTGYMECTGHIENWCKCSVQEAHDTLIRLEKKGLIIGSALSPKDNYGHARNIGWTVNVPYLQAILDCYMTKIWS